MLKKRGVGDYEFAYRTWKNITAAQNWFILSKL